MQLFGFGRRMVPLVAKPNGQPKKCMTKVSITERPYTFSFTLTPENLHAVLYGGLEHEMVRAAVDEGRKLVIDCGEWHVSRHVPASQTKFDRDGIPALRALLFKHGIETTTDFDICKGKTHLYLIGNQNPLISTPLDIPEFSYEDFRGVDDYVDQVFRSLEKSVEPRQLTKRKGEQNPGIEVSNKPPYEVRFSFFPHQSRRDSLLLLSALDHALENYKKVTIFQPEEMICRSHVVFSIEKSLMDGFNVVVNNYSDVNGNPDSSSKNYIKVFAMVLNHLQTKGENLNIEISRVGNLKKELFEQAFREYIRKATQSRPYINFTHGEYQTSVNISA